MTGDTLRIAAHDGEPNHSAHVAAISGDGSVIAFTSWASNVTPQDSSGYQDVFVFDPAGHFVERVDGARADLRDGFWEVKDAWVVRLGREPEKFDTYLLSTYLTPDRVTDALGTLFSVSFWELPGLIEVAEKAKLSSSRLRIQYEALMSRPLLCAAMVLLAATVSLGSFRSGGIQTMVVAGLVGGFGFFLIAEVSRQIGVAGLAPSWAAIWLPVVLAVFVSATVLLHQEDG
jgi:lipopolysaccharide export system permease protein